jgi:hypothetical protein
MADARPPYQKPSAKQLSMASKATQHPLKRQADPAYRIEF